MSTRGVKATQQVRHVEIGPDFQDQRIDNFLLRELKGVPRSLVYRLLRKGQVRVNGGRIKADYRLSAGDRVRVPPVRRPEEGETVAPPAGVLKRTEAAIIYEDDSVLVVNKPSGMAVHGGSGVPYGLVDVLRALRPTAKGLDLVHRLDRGTSGCILVAKKRSALRLLHAAFREGRVEKRYLALVAGRLPRGEVPVEAALRRVKDRSGEHRVRTDGSGKASRTVFRARERFADATLVQAELGTGRMHQIRVHAASMGHPVLGDAKYGDDEANGRLRTLGLKRMFLHAEFLRLALPDGRPLSVEAALPDDLARVLAALRKTG